MTTINSQEDFLRDDTDDMGLFKSIMMRREAISEALFIASDMGFKYTRTVPNEEIDRMAQEAAGSDIPTNQLRSFRKADLLIEANDGQNTHYIAVEVSFTGDRRDTERAKRNAGFLTRFTGCAAHAAIASVKNDREIKAELESGVVFWYEMEDLSQREH